MINYQVEYTLKSGKILVSKVEEAETYEEAYKEEWSFYIKGADSPDTFMSIIGQDANRYMFFLKELDYLMIRSV